VGRAFLDQASKAPDRTWILTMSSTKAPIGYDASADIDDIQPIEIIRGPGLAL